MRTFFPMNGISNKVFHVVHCRAGEQTGAFDSNEIHAVRWVSLDEARWMLRSGFLRDGFTLTALLWHLGDTQSRDEFQP